MITLQQAQVSTGSIIEGSVAPDAGANTAWLVWRLTLVHTRILALGGTAIEDYTLVEKCQLDAGSGGTFEFEIPTEGPISYDGKLIRIAWEIVAGTESSGGAEVAAYASFTVVPS